jgi:hypothetical protein
MDVHASSPVIAAAIEAVRLRKTAPPPEDRRDWQHYQCPHCTLLFWALPLGKISFWHRNPLRRLWWWFRNR